MNHPIYQQMKIQKLFLIDLKITTDLELNKYEIIEKLTKASYVEVRITTNFSKMI